MSDDGQALVVHRFDVDDDGQAHWGMEDFCSLLGLRPAAKYDTTWGRVAKAVRDHVPGAQRQATHRQLATILLLTYALRNADCHAKNIALLYTSRADVHLSPAYDMLTTRVYAGVQHNPPGIEFMGKRMLMAWAAEVQGLRDQRVFGPGDAAPGGAFADFSPPPSLTAS